MRKNTVEGGKNIEGIQQEVRKTEDRGNKKQNNREQCRKKRTNQKTGKKLSQGRRKEVKKRRKSTHSQAYVGRRPASEMKKFNVDNEEPIGNLTRQAMYVLT